MHRPIALAPNPRAHFQRAHSSGTQFELPPPPFYSHTARLATVLLDHHTTAPSFTPPTYLFAVLPNGETICGFGRLRKLRRPAVSTTCHL